MLKVDSTFPSTQFLINGFSIPHRLDRNNKAGAILLYVRDKIIVLALNRYSLSPHIEIFFFLIKSEEPKMACMLFLQSPQKPNQGTFTSTFRRYSVLF